MKKEFSLSELFMFWSAWIIGQCIVALIFNDWKVAFLSIFSIILGSTMFYFIWGQKV